MSLTSATIERIGTVATPEGEVVVETIPGTNGAPGHGWHDILVLRPADHQPDGTRAMDVATQHVGKVVNVLVVDGNTRTTVNHFMWGAGGVVPRVHGAMVNPTPISGHYYRMLDNGGFLLRYNDEENRSARHSENHPWSIVGGANGEPHIPDDALQLTGSARPSAYVEVTKPEGWETTVDASLGIPKVLDQPPIVENHTNRYISNWWDAADGAAGAPILNPERTIGEMYLTWSNTNQREVFVSIWLGEGSWGVVGYLYEQTYVESTGTKQTEEVLSNWCKMAKRWVPEPEVSEERNQRLTAMLAEVVEADRQRIRFNVALNNLARRHDWCGEYDNIIKRTGMAGRRDALVIPSDLDVPEEEEPEHQYYVTVRVSGEWSKTASSADDRRLAEMDDELMSVDAGSVTVQGTASFRFLTDGSYSTDPDSDDFDDDDIENYFNSNSNFTMESLDEWTITETEEYED